MFIQTTIIILIVTLLAMLMAGRFVRPIEELTHVARRIIEGDSGHRVNIQSRDEFGELATSFNQMVDELDQQKNKIEEQSVSNEKLLHNFIPEQLASRLKKGEHGFADEYQNVSLIVIDIVGFSKLTEKVGATDSVTMLNEIVVAFDEAAERNYIEKIKTVGDTYFAACGLFKPRLDHAKRIVQFAKEVQHMIEQFNLNHRSDLKVHTSVNSGSVVAGIVGEEKYSFDVWGVTVNHVFQINELEIDNEILASQSIAERLQDFYAFTLLSKKGKHGEPVYTLNEKAE